MRMYKPLGRPGFRRYWRVGARRGVALDQVGSWGDPMYRPLGAWWHMRHRGFTLRYRDLLLVVTW